jgi:hypothetical protein
LLLEQKRRALAQRNLLQFTEYTTPRWKPGKIHRVICEQLDRVVNKEVDRLLLLCPPQHGKSRITSERFPAYLLGQNPEMEVVSASATAQLAERFGREVRNCISSQEYQVLFTGTQLAEDSQAKGLWRTAQGGGYYAVGIGGALMGRGGELGIIDDPFATWEDAQSEGQREKVWDWYTGTFYNRIRPSAPIIVIQHRMHEDDLVGRLLAQQQTGGDKWEVVELPATLEDPPWPERYDRKALERIRDISGARKWSALYMQNPTPDEGTFFKREWFKRYTPEMLPANLHKYFTSDHAPAGNEKGDYSGVRVWGLEGNDLYLLDGFRTQETMDVTMEKVVGCKAKGLTGLIQKHKPLCWFPEDDNNWKSVAGYVRKAMLAERQFCRLEPISPHGHDKVVKAQAIQGMASNGCVWLPAGPQGDEILEQYIRFPGGKNDDEVDMGAIIGRAIDQAHPAITSPKVKPDPRDNWDDEDEPTSWKVA